MSDTTVFISGATRGLGRGLLQRFLALNNVTVIAANRNVDHPSSQALADLPKGKESKLIIVKVDANVEQDAARAVKELQQKHGIEHLDIVIANAGVSYVWPTVADAKLDDIRAHFAPNVFGVIDLYQATRPLLQKSSKEPIFAPIGSTAGCIAYVFTPIHFEFLSLMTIPLCISIAPNTCRRLNKKPHEGTNCPFRMHATGPQRRR